MRRRRHLRHAHAARRRGALPDAFVERIAAADLLAPRRRLHRPSRCCASSSAIGPPLVGRARQRRHRRAAPAAAAERAWSTPSGARIAMVHDAGPPAGRLERMRARFPRRADAVVFGHSHLPLHERADDGFQIFNPGSPTDRRRAPAHTMGLARVDGAARRVRADRVNIGGMDLDVLFVGTAGSAPSARPRPARHAGAARRRSAAVRLRRGHPAPAACARPAWSSSRRSSSRTSTPTTCSACRACSRRSRCASASAPLTVYGPAGLRGAVRGARTRSSAGWPSRSTCASSSQTRSCERDGYRIAAYATDHGVQRARLRAGRGRRARASSTPSGEAARRDARARLRAPAGGRDRQRGQPRSGHGRAAPRPRAS